MFGFLIGTACLIGLISTIRRGFHGGCHGGYRYAGHFDHGHHGCGPRGYRGGFDEESEGPWGAYRERGNFGRPRHGFRGFRGFGPRAWVAMLSDRLELSPAQERVVGQAFGEVRDTIRKQRGELSETRKDVAKAFRASSFDAVLMGDVFGRHDSKMDEVRKAVVGALAKVHEALDERQREKLASILEEGWW